MVHLGRLSFVGAIASGILVTPISQAAAPSEQLTVSQEPDSLSDSVPAVNQFTDVQPTDWAYEAIQALVERYGVITGYPDGTFRGDRPLTRYEFAAVLKAVLERVEQLVGTGSLDQDVLQEDLTTMQRLRQDFFLEYTVLRGQVDAIQSRTIDLEATQFSATTKLTGQALFAFNAGGFEGDRILDPVGETIATEDPQATLLYRVALDLNTSFTGSDLLKLRLDQGSDGFDDNAAGVLEPSFGSVLDYSTKPPNEDLGLSRLYYTFNPFEDLSVSIGPVLSPTDYLDRNQYTSLSFLDFSTQAFAYNYLLFPVPGLGAGAAVDWNPNGGPFTLRSVYTALAGNDPTADSLTPVPGLFPASRFLYPEPEGDRGLFGTPRQGIVEIEYAPTEALALRFQYSGGTIYDEPFDVLGANIEYTLGERLGIIGRYGYASYNNTALGDIKPNYWMAGLTFSDVIREGDRSGILVGQPFIANEAGDGTQTNVEAFYNFTVNDNLRVTPLVQVIINPGNQEANGTIFTGTLRTVILF